MKTSDSLVSVETRIDDVTAMGIDIAVYELVEHYKMRSPKPSKRSVLRWCIELGLTELQRRIDLGQKLDDLK